MSTKVSIVLPYLCSALGHNGSSPERGCQEDVCTAACYNPCSYAQVGKRRNALVAQAYAYENGYREELSLGLQFGIFDHIEPVPGLSLQQIYRERLLQLERYDVQGFTPITWPNITPAVHSLAPSQNVFLAAASQRTQHIRLAPCVDVLPLHHPLRLIEEVCMLDHLSNGRLELGVGRGGVLEAYFWGSEAEVERNYVKYQETLDILRQGLSHEELTYQGEFYRFDALPMRLHPQQQPYPPLWYMRNADCCPGGHARHPGGHPRWF